MFEKFKSLKKYQKSSIVGAIVVLFLGVVLVSYNLFNDHNSKTDLDSFSNLINKTYSLSDFNSDGQSAFMNLKMDEGVSKDELKELASVILEKSKKENWSEKAVSFNIFNDEISSDYNFYTKGLYGTLDINLEDATVKIGEFIDVPKVSPSSLNEISKVTNEGVTKSEDKAIITLDMDIADSEDKILEQALAYSDMVKFLNKDIKSVQLNINTKENKYYEASSDFNDIIKYVEIFTLKE